MPTYQELAIKTALHRLDTSYLPYQWDLNIYRGCEHKCVYCYALYSHKYLNEEKFFDTIFIKTNVAQMLDIALNKRTWKSQIINLGGVTDSYQPAEAKYGLMRDILKICIKYEQPIIISTKSTLILRDIDLFTELAQKTFVGIAVTLITTDADLQKKLEPNAATPKEKLNIIAEFKKTKARVGCHAMPILPYLTDSPKQLDDLFSAVKTNNADYLISGLLNLRGQTRTHFLNFLQKQFPQIWTAYQQLYFSKDKLIYKNYKINLYQNIHQIRQKYKLFNPPENITNNLADEQLALF
jgi:DNA repair photolyase